MTPRQPAGRLSLLARRIKAPVAPLAAVPRGSVTRTITMIAAAAALIVAIVPPASFFFAAWFRALGALEASAALHAVEISELARRNPALWDMDGLLVTGARPQGAESEHRRVFNAAGRLILESQPDTPLAWPVISHSEPIWQDGEVAGRAESRRSLRGTLVLSLLSALPATLLGAMIFVALRWLPIRQLDRALRRASYLATHDVLTGLPNRALFADRLQQAAAATLREGGLVAVLCLDLDRFKEVNDTLGHAAGDELLTLVARRLSRCLRGSDTLARLGGDEFAIILSRVQQPDSLDRLAEALLDSLREPIRLQAGEVRIGLSIGIALEPPAAEAELQQIVQKADLALYEAKEVGRGDYRFFQPAMNQRLQERRELEADLQQALAGSGFSLVFQPQHSLATRGVVGAEALLRWDRTGYGPTSPEVFVPIAEETGLIVAIGAWVLHEACRQAAAWPEPLTIAVNVSPVQFRKGDLVATVAAALAQSRLPPERLELEVTEGILLKDTEETLACLSAIRRLGVRIAMDDFGTGYSSLGYLQRFPFDKVKIDRRFVQAMNQDPRAHAIVRAVLAMSEALGLRVNAEGVEHEEQLTVLRELGCDEVQGYLLARPMPGEAFLQLLQPAQQAPQRPAA